MRETQSVVFAPQNDQGMKGTRAEQAAGILNKIEAWKADL